MGAARGRPLMDRHGIAYGPWVARMLLADGRWLCEASCCGRWKPQTCAYLATCRWTGVSSCLPCSDRGGKRAPDDITGQPFGPWVPVSMVPGKRRYGSAVWLVRASCCGAEREADRIFLWASRDRGVTKCKACDLAKRVETAKHPDMPAGVCAWCPPGTRRPMQTRNECMTHNRRACRNGREADGRPIDRSVKPHDLTGKLMGHWNVLGPCPEGASVGWTVVAACCGTTRVVSSKGLRDALRNRSKRCVACANRPRPRPVRVQPDHQPSCLCRACTDRRASSLTVGAQKETQEVE